MHVVVVYESLFGNTRDVAEAVAAGIVAASPGARVDCRSVDEMASLADVDLVVVGGPTHALGLTTRMTRALEFQYERRLRPRLGRAETGPRRAAETSGLRAWLAGLPPGADTAAAAFDTRMDAAVPGGAAPQIARLGRRGYRLMAEPAAFTVEGVAVPCERASSSAPPAGANTSPQPSAPVVATRWPARPYQSPYVLGDTR